jgi:Domain of unknown function (DUF4436)
VESAVGGNRHGVNLADGRLRRSLAVFHVWETPVERDLGAKSAAGSIPQIYIEPVSIEALNDAMQMRISFAPSGTFYGERLAPTERRLRLVITHDKAVEEIRIEANARPPAATFEVDLNGGSVADYPLDSYRADLRVQLFEDAIPAVDEAKPLAAKVTVWEGALGSTYSRPNMPAQSRVKLG